MKKRRSEMTRLCQSALLVMFSVMLAGCAATGPKYSGVPEPTPGHGTLVVYRIKQALNSGGWTRIRVDGKTGDKSLKCGGYAVYSLAPGPHEVKFPYSILWPWGCKWTANILPGENLYYRVGFGLDGAQKVGATFVVNSRICVQSVPEEFAKKEMCNMCLINPDGLASNKTITANSP